MTSEGEGYLETNVQSKIKNLTSFYKKYSYPKIKERRHLTF
jgi:hypothetical protein